MRHLEHVANPNSGRLHLVDGSVALCGWIPPKLARGKGPKLGGKCSECFQARRREACLDDWAEVIAPVRLDVEDWEPRCRGCGAMVGHQLDCADPVYVKSA